MENKNHNAECVKLELLEPLPKPGELVECQSLGSQPPPTFIKCVRPLPKTIKVSWTGGREPLPFYAVYDFTKQYYPAPAPQTPKYDNNTVVSGNAPPLSLAFEIDPEMEASYYDEISIANQLRAARLGGPQYTPQGYFGSELYTLSAVPKGETAVVSDTTFVANMQQVNIGDWANPIMVWRYYCSDQATLIRYWQRVITGTISVYCRLIDTKGKTVEYLPMSSAMQNRIAFPAYGYSTPLPFRDDDWFRIGITVASGAVQAGFSGDPRGFHGSVAKIAPLNSMAPLYFDYNGGDPYGSGISGWGQGVIDRRIGWPGYGYCRVSGSIGLDGTWRQDAFSGIPYPTSLIDLNNPIPFTVEPSE